MRRLWPVVRREYLERVRSKAFLVATLAGPALVAGVLLLPSLVMAKQRGKALRIAVVDASGALEAPVGRALAERTVEGEARFQVLGTTNRAPEGAAEQMRAAVLAGRLDGYLYLPPDAMVRSAAEYHGRNVSNVLDLRLLEEAVEQAVVRQRLAVEGLDAGRVKEVMKPLDLKLLRVSAGGEREDRGSSFMFSLVLLMMLYTTAIMWGQATMTGVIEEKTSRVVEVVVSSIDTGTLLLGKLLGVGAAGLTQIVTWAAALAAIGLYAGATWGLGGPRPPEITPLLLGSFVACFLLGFFLYATLYAALGAAVNSVQEAQGLAFPIVLPLILSVMFFGPVLSSPDGALSTTLSLIPFFTPLLMFLRITVQTPPAWQIALSMVLTGLTIAGVIWAAGRIYRVGILTYGKRPTLPEIMRWVRHP